MRDEKRKELAMLEEAYKKVNENFGPAALTASVPGVSELPLMVGEQPEEDEGCGSIQPDIETVAAQAIAAITELAAAAGANISVTVDIGEQEVEEVEVIDQFNTGYEDAGST
jgi:hypothetical protein|tara:strand:- start:829 stop:1164 length:336 start_codon:yes stop_codon:yes gene_type:complete